MRHVFFCPLSDEIVEATYSLSERLGVPLGLVATVNQVGPNTYTGFTRAKLRRAMTTLERRFPAADVTWNRDHLGRYGEELYDVIAADVNVGVSLVHLHTNDRRVVAKVCNDWPEQRFEVGPGEDEIDWAVLEDLPPNVEWVSFPTGCKIDGNRNSQTLDEAACDRARETGRLLRGHNCDYISARTIGQLRHLVDGVNVAPQVAVIQCLLMRAMACTDGIELTAWDYSIAEDERQKGHELGSHYHLDLVPAAWRARVKPLILSAVERAMERIARGFL